MANADNEQLPSQFDVIVIGTGLTESIVSAAVSRGGHSCLHIDPRDYYGGKWGTLCWENWITGEFAKIPSRVSATSKNPENNIDWKNDVSNFEQVWYLRTPISNEDDDDDRSFEEKMLGLSRRFNIDIFPKVLMAREQLIKLLIHSNVSRYLEFKCITKLFSTLLPPNEHIIEPIPLSRSDIFTTKTISLLEKRSLMKFIEAIMKTFDNEGNEEQIPSAEPMAVDENGEGHHQQQHLERKSFEELCKECNLSKKVQHLLRSAVRTMDDCYFEMNSGFNDIGKGEEKDLKLSSVFNRDFATHCKQFLASIGQYGNRTPFLWTLYGISEICQAFCRMSAIYGGIFILKRNVESIQINEVEDYKVQLKSEGKEIRAKYLVLAPEIKLQTTWDNARGSPKSRQGITLARAVLVTTGPRLQTSSKTTAVAPDDDPTNLTIHRLDDMDIMELDDTSLAVPKNYRLLQVTCPYVSQSVPVRTLIESRLSPFIDFCYVPQQKSPDSTSAAATTTTSSSAMMMAEEEGEPSIQQQQPQHHPNEIKEFLPPTKPVVIYGSYFLLDFYDDIQSSENTAENNIFSCSVSSTEITEHVEKGRQIFSQMFPNEEFLPKAPDPVEAIENNEIYPGEEDGLADNNEVVHMDDVDEEEAVIVNAMQNGYVDPMEHPNERINDNDQD